MNSHLLEMSYGNKKTSFSYDILLHFRHNQQAQEQKCCMKTVKAIFIQHKFEKNEKMSYEMESYKIYTTFGDFKGAKSHSLSLNDV